MKTGKKFFATMMALMMVLPLQVKAAEVAQQPETLTLVEVKASYYKEVENDGMFYRYDEEGNLISSEKVEKALFEVNATLQSGWGQGTVNGDFVKGTFKDVTLDNKGYLRCTFTTESGVVYDEVIVKVQAFTYKSLSKRGTGNSGNTGDNGGNSGNTGDNGGNSGNTGNNGGNSGNTGNNGGNSGNTGDNGGNSGNTGNNGGNSGNAGDNGGNSSNAGDNGDETPDLPPDNTGWEEPPTPVETPDEAPDLPPGNTGWFD